MFTMFTPSGYVNARLIYGIAYVEEGHGYYDAPLNAIGLNKSIRPMNINTDYWGNAFGTRAQLSNLQFNFNAGAELLSRITANLPADSSVAHVATLYNNINATEVSSYGMRVQAIYDNGP